MGIPTLIQEQNSYAGVTNKLLAQKAEKICVAYEGMERFFDEKQNHSDWKSGQTRIVERKTYHVKKQSARSD